MLRNALRKTWAAMAFSAMVLAAVAARAGQARFAVLSDTHVYDVQALGCAGPAWEAYLAQDRKMLKESVEILDAALEDLAGRDLDFVLVTGDLTKDGEALDHGLFAARLAALRATGKRVYVIPGNHDINNPDAVAFTEAGTRPVERTSPAAFKEIYADCGYASALAQDPDSLSYVAEPVPGLWLLALDSADYERNEALGRPVTSGRFKPATLAWILERLREARERGKVVIGAMHHGIVEHFKGQALQYPEYLVEDHERVGGLVARNGMNLVFTGHFHANDVSAADFGDVRLTDCETGSLVTAPSPYRLAVLDLATRHLECESGHVRSIPSHPCDFQDFAGRFLRSGLAGLAERELTQAPFCLDRTQAAPLVRLAVEAMAAHYAGDERLDDPEAALAIRKLCERPEPAFQMLGASLLSLWSDLAPGDNSFQLGLTEP